MAIYQASSLDNRITAFFEGMAKEGIPVSKYINHYRLERDNSGMLVFTFTMPLSEKMEQALFASKQE